jgi:hypothetical protein
MANPPATAQGIGVTPAILSLGNHALPRRRCCLWRAIVLAAFVFGAPALGQETADLLSKALELVRQVEHSASAPLMDAQHIQMLQQALQMTREAPNHRLQGHRVLAQQAIRDAIAGIRSADPVKAAAGLHTAEIELSTSVSLAGAAEAANMPTKSVPIASTPGGSLPAAIEPLPQVLRPAGEIADVASPGVTPEMEAAFLVKYKAALGEQSPDAFLALFATDSQMDPKAKDAVKGFELLGFALDSSHSIQTCAFIPVPADQLNKPTEIDGKMYGDYLPPVIALKITFGAEAHPSPGGDVVGATVPLCLQNNQLMLVGTREIPGAVPPPVKKSFNFGLTPNIRQAPGKEDPLDFGSLDEFLSSLKQPRLQILASGKTPLVYYAVCRVGPNGASVPASDSPSAETWKWASGGFDSRTCRTPRAWKPGVSPGFRASHPADRATGESKCGCSR